MSSTADSLKQPADGASSEEPNSKKAKLDETKADVKNGNPTNDAEDKDTDPQCILKVPSKAVNGQNNNDDRDDEDNNNQSAQEDGDGSLDDDSVLLEGMVNPKIAKTLEQVEKIQLEICSLNEKASEEILKVEQKFNKLRRPHFEQRNELLKNVSQFWVTALSNHPIVRFIIESPEDEDCLHYMVNLDVEEFEDIKSGYKLKLHFEENPYITNEVIVKEFQIVSSEEVVSSSTPIEYKNTPQGNRLKKVVENSISEQMRSRPPNQNQRSFFAWLTEPCESGTDEIAEIIKDIIWPNPLEYYFAATGEYGAGSDDESDDDDDEELDDEDMDDDEDDGIMPEEAEFSDEDGLEGEEDDEEDVE